MYQFGWSVANGWRFLFRWATRFFAINFDLFIRLYRRVNTWSAQTSTFWPRTPCVFVYLLCLSSYSLTALGFHFSCLFAGGTRCVCHLFGPSYPPTKPPTRHLDDELSRCLLPFLSGLVIV